MSSCGDLAFLLVIIFPIATPPWLLLFPSEPESSRPPSLAPQPCVYLSPQGWGARTLLSVLLLLAPDPVGSMAARAPDRKKARGQGSREENPKARGNLCTQLCFYSTRPLGLLLLCTPWRCLLTFLFLLPVSSSPAGLTQ